MDGEKQSKKEATHQKIICQPNLTLPIEAVEELGLGRVRLCL